MHSEEEIEPQLAERGGGARRIVGVMKSGVADLRARWIRFVDWFNARELDEHAVLFGFAVAIGVMAALGVIAFYKAIDLSYAAFYRWPSTYLPRLGVLAYRWPRVVIRWSLGRGALGRSIQRSRHPPTGRTSAGTTRVRVDPARNSRSATARRSDHRPIVPSTSRRSTT